MNNNRVNISNAQWEVIRRQRQVSRRQPSLVSRVLQLLRRKPKGGASKPALT